MASPPPNPEDQPVPQVTLADVERVVRRDFPPDEVGSVLQCLEEYGGQAWHREIPRVRLAILKLAAGNGKKLRASLATANDDYRDVLSYAEYPGYLSGISPSEKDPTRRQRAIDADWRQYRQWLERP
jgi:hypothetical protein